MFEQAGVTNDQIDIVQTYDDYPVISMMQLEDLGFCKKGKGAEFVRQTDLTFDGPHTPPAIRYISAPNHWRHPTGGRFYPEPDLQN